MRTARSPRSDRAPRSGGRRIGGSARATRAAVLLAASISLAATAAAAPGTREQRAALFDEILEKTRRRTAFSPEKPRTLGLPEAIDMATLVRREMLRLRPEVLDADTDMRLFWALSALSNVRRDQHVSVRPAEGGLEIDVGFYGPQGDAIGHAPIKFKPDYGDPKHPVYFVSDTVLDYAAHGVHGRRPQVGDVLVEVNGSPVDEYVAYLGRYLTSSTNEALAWSISNVLPIRFFGIPPEAYRSDATLVLTLRPEPGEPYELSLPYVPYRDLDWSNYEDHPFYGTDEQRARPPKIDPYPGYRKVWDGASFDLFRSADPAGPLLLRWHRFRSALLEEVPRLLELAEAEGLADAGLIWDGTRSTGGTGGAWVLQRLQGRPFRMTFGNLRISDVTPELVGTLREHALAGIEASGSPTPPTTKAREIESMDAGHFLLDWIDSDVAPAIAARQAYTNDVPFKSYFLPRYSDGWVHPARRHLTGPIALLLGPHGCSHVDQFAAMVIDNDLGHSTGMPAGGCSNTWEFDEVLRFPGTERPVVRWAWTAGQAIRPNGEVLEGNPARVRSYRPLTRANYATYRQELLRDAQAYIAREKAAPTNGSSAGDGPGSR